MSECQKCLEKPLTSYCSVYAYGLVYCVDHFSIVCLIYLHGCSPYVVQKFVIVCTLVKFTELFDDLDINIQIFARLIEIRVLLLTLVIELWQQVQYEKLVHHFYCTHWYFWHEFF